MKNGRDGEYNPELFEARNRMTFRGDLLRTGLCTAALLVLAYGMKTYLGLNGGAFLFVLVLVSVIAVQFALYLREKNRARLVNAFMSVMTETSGGCYWEWDPATGSFRLAPKGVTLFGKDVGNFDDLLALLHPDDVFNFRRAAESLLSEDNYDGESSEKSLSAEFRIQSVMGNWRWFVVRSSGIERAGDGRVSKITGSMLDIDAYKRAVEAMRASERRLTTIFRSAPGSMAVTDSDGNLIDANQAFYDMLGFSAEELQGVPIMSLSDTPYDKESKVIMQEILRECESYEDSRFHLEEDFVCRNGHCITLDYGISAILDFDGNILNYIFSGIDITLQKKHAAELRLLAENQRWLFDFLRQFNQFDGIGQLFEALKENLPKVVSFSSLKLIVPSFLDKAWVLDNVTEYDAETTQDELTRLLAGIGPSGRTYVSRTAIAWGDLARDGGADQIHSVLAIPLVYKETMWGVMVLESPVARAFSDQDVTLMSIVGTNIGLYFEEQSNRAELDTHTERLQQLHLLIHSLLRTRNRDHLLEGMLGYLREAVSDSSCAVYLFNGERDVGAAKLERLAWYDEEDIPVPDSTLVLKSIAQETPISEYGEHGEEIRKIVPIVFHTHNVGAVDLCKPSGILPTELKMFQLLMDYVAGFWVLYEIMALREEEASVDPLTGIWNRRYMIRRLQEESDRITRYGGNACLVIGDMGNFKHTNDNYGHSKGDEVLVKSAAAIKKNLRLSDSVGRYGGDEFILLLPNVTRTDADVIIERIKLELAQVRILSDDSDPDSPPISVVMDFGLALFPGGASSLMDTVNLADEAMYLNKTERKAQAAWAAEGRIQGREDHEEKGC